MMNFQEYYPWSHACQTDWPELLSNHTVSDASLSLTSSYNTPLLDDDWTTPIPLPDQEQQHVYWHKTLQVDGTVAIPLAHQGQRAYQPLYPQLPVQHFSNPSEHVEHPVHQEYQACYDYPAYNGNHAHHEPNPYALPAFSTEMTPFGLESEDHVYPCRWYQCSVRMATLDQLIVHIRDIHVGSGKPAYFCLWAGCPRSRKPFTKRHKMHNHMRTHTGERPFACTVQACNKRFSRPDSLSTHIKTHSNVRPYPCRVSGCGKAYFHSRSLRKHTKSHEQEAKRSAVSHHTMDLSLAHPRAHSEWTPTCTRSTWS